MSISQSGTMLAGILLAAGQSRRFGSSNKLTALQSNGIPVAVAALRSLASVVDQVYATVAPEALRLAQQLQAESALIVPCPQARNGMGASLACGIQAAYATSACLVALADMPFIQMATLQRVATALRRGSALVAPCYQGKRGHPVGFSHYYYPALIHLTGDDGAKHLLRENANTLCLLPTQDAGVLQDIDFPQDLTPNLSYKPA